MDLVLRGPDLLKLTSKGEMGGGGFADLIALLIRTLHVIIVDERERQHWATFNLGCLAGYRAGRLALWESRAYFHFSSPIISLLVPVLWRTSYQCYLTTFCSLNDWRDTNDPCAVRHYHWFTWCLNIYFCCVLFFPRILACQVSVLATKMIAQLLFLPV